MKTLHSTSTQRACRGGQTLAELMITIPLMTLLVAGMGSAIKVATKAVPDSTSTSSAALSSARALDLFAGDVAFATSITTNVTTTAAARQLTFVIPDRDGVAPATETVTYSWSGVSGDPLLRTFNGTTTTVATNLQEFQLAYDKRATSVVNNTTNTSAETLLISSDGSSSLSDEYLTSSNWCGQYFLPVLSSTVTGWNVTKVKFRAKQHSAPDGTFAVQIRSSQNRLPTSTVLDQQTMTESSLSGSYVLQTVTFANVPIQSPTQGLCLVLKSTAGTFSADFNSWGGGGLGNSYIVRTTSSGGSWTPTTGDSLRYYVYGTVTTNSSSTSTQYLLTNVRCTIRVGGATSSRLTTSFRVPNEPQVAGP